MADSQKLVLPLEYQEVEYIENTGTTQYIDTGWKRDFNKDIEIEAVIKLSTINKRYCIISDYSSQYQYNMSFEVTGDNFGRVFINAANNLVGTHIYNSNEFNIFKYSYDHTTPSGTVEVNSGSDSKTYQTEVRRIAVDNARIFVDKDSRFSTFNYSFKLQKMRIKEDNVLVRNFIPCYRKSDNEAGLYDTVNGVFYTNQGTGSFTVGANVSSWQHSLRKLTTAADDITTFPATIYGVGGSSTDWELEGNTVQNGTPSSSSPVEVNGVGERTVQLFDKDNAIMNKEINGYSYQTNNDYYITNFIPVTSGETYSKNANIGTSLLLYHNADFNETVTQKISLAGDGSFTIPEGYNYIVGNGRKTLINSANINKGSTLLPYEPYGYKLTFTDGQQTTNIYLGSTQTTRPIRKLVFTGTESFTKVGGYDYIYVYPLTYLYKAKSTELICTHLPMQTSLPVNRGFCISSDLSTSYMNFGAAVMDIQPSGDTVEGLKEYLASQYANGTPVTVYYPLQDNLVPTAAVNEPLMKIGDYADSITQTQAGTAIQLSDGKSTLDIDSDVKPSKLTLTYKGWHDASVKEWDGSQWNE